MSKAPTLAQLDFEKIVEVDFDSSNVAIGACLTKQVIQLFSLPQSLEMEEKNSAKFDKEFYAIFKLFVFGGTILLARILFSTPIVNFVTS